MRKLPVESPGDVRVSIKFFVKYKYGDRKTKVHLSDDKMWPELIADFLDFLTQEGGPGYIIDPFLKEKIIKDIEESHFQWAMGMMKACEALIKSENDLKQEEIINKIEVECSSFSERKDDILTDRGGD